MKGVSITPVRLSHLTATIQGERRGIVILPSELIQQIFTDVCISRDDLKSLRLLCRAVTEQATQLLFYRICLSKLKTDRNAFLNIATCPRIARVVRVLVWYELAEDERTFSALQNFPTAGFGAANKFDYPPGEDIYTKLIIQAHDMFWMPSQKEEESNMTDETSDAKITAIEEFRPHFYAALDAMPSLHTVTTQPMHPYRRLTNSLSGYPLTAYLLQCGMMATQSQMNEGFYSLLGPAMARRSSTSSLITRLHFADEGLKTSLIRLHLALLPAFAPLTHIDLCISHLSNPLELDSLGACLRGAVNLTHLRLCCERGTSYFEVGEGRKAVFEILLCHTAANWVNLCNLHLDDLWFLPADLVEFVRKHVSSLRYLRADSCNLTTGSVANLAKITGLKLNQFVALPSPAHEEVVYMSESQVLTFLNSNGADIALCEALNRNRSANLRTHASVFDPECWVTGAIYDSRGQDGLRRGYTVSEIDILDLEDGGVRNEDRYRLEETSHWEMPFQKMLPEMHNIVDEHEEEKYVSEQASHLRRCCEAPRWMWGFEGDNFSKIYYWAVENEDEPRGVGHPTEMWRFKHRNGEVACGNDPLEFWEDWEGSEAGDMTEATPFGLKFRSYLMSHSEGRLQNPWGAVPEGRAIEYYNNIGQGSWLGLSSWEDLLASQAPVWEGGDSESE